MRARATRTTETIDINDFAQAICPSPFRAKYLSKHEADSVAMWQSVSDREDRVLRDLNPVAPPGSQFL